MVNHPNLANPIVMGPLSTKANLSNTLDKLNLTSEDLPDSYDLRDNYNLSPVEDQKQCGSCWAMSSTAALTDKYRMKSGGDLILDPLITLACTPDNNGKCGGGSPYSAGQFFEEHGVGPAGNGCGSWVDFVSKPDYVHNPPDCSSETCPTDYKAVANSTQYLAVQTDGKVDPQATVDHIKATILADGPVVSCFFVPNAFMKDEGGWANPDSSTKGMFIGGDDSSDIINEGGGPAAHAVEMVGWGVMDASELPSGIDLKGQKKITYWIIKNSWSENWGDDGYFKFAAWPFNTALSMDVPAAVNNQYLGSPITFKVNDKTFNATPVGKETSDKKKRNIILLLLVLICIGVGIFLYMRYRR